MIGKIFLNHMMNFDLKKSLKLLNRNDYCVFKHEPRPYFVNKNSKKKY